MFDDEKYKRWRNLMQAIDRINQKFGKDALRFASVKTEGKQKTKRHGKVPAIRPTGKNCWLSTEFENARKILSFHSSLNLLFIILLMTKDESI
ncbi:MAG TPA: DUF4113 domain-containing protein [Pyrinomonadaceae bacterium]